MLKFNAAGFLTPSSVVKSTLNEFESYFAVEGVDNKRRALFESYLNYKNRLKEACGAAYLKQWIDGSYVTKKDKPNDIDLVNFINYRVIETKEAELKEFIYPGSFVNYGLDRYVIIVYPEDHKLHFAYLADCSYWINLFDKTKPDRWHKRAPKGFLEIIV